LISTNGLQKRKKPDVKKARGRSLERVVVDGMVGNILTHYVGYMVGFFVPAVVSVYIVERKKE